MILKRSALYSIIILFLSLRMAAQPTLPAIAGSAEKGLVVLSWTCQYNGVKSIAVMRSSDSAFNYSIIGYVKKLDKGVQAFVDGHPLAGKNFYRLSVVFSSGLSWSSNHCSVFVPKAELESAHPLPSNDSLQRFITTEAGKTAPLPEGPKTQEPKAKVCITFGADTSLSTIRGGSQPFPNSNEKVVITFENPDVDQPIFIKSRFISADPVTGHVNMHLPDDIKQHHYSIKFYDTQKNVIVEVPKINVPVSILDKRNFQKKGVIRFVLRRDGIEFESGYITVY